MFKSISLTHKFSACPNLSSVAVNGVLLQMGKGSGVDTPKCVGTWMMMLVLSVEG
jgi:hypothetical protein